MARAKKKSAKTVKAAAKVAFKTKIKNFPDFAGMHYIEVAKPAVQKLGGKFLIRLVCTLNGKLSYQCGLQSLGGGKGTGWVGVNKARMQELSLVKGSTVRVELKPDTSKYGLPMPEELEELLRQDDEGSRRFHLLKPGRQRNILHFVSVPKNTDRRLDRAVAVIENLKRLEEGTETIEAIFNIHSSFNRVS